MRPHAPVALALLIAGANVALAQDPTPLWRAVKDRKVLARARAESGHELAWLSLENRTDARLTIDVNASYVAPEGRTRTRTGAPLPRTRERAPEQEYQPLGLGILAAGKRDTTVQLAPGQKVELTVLSTCMNSGASSPWDGMVMHVVPEEPPALIASVLRDWRADPMRPQGDIQARVWQCPPVVCTIPAEPQGGALGTRERSADEEDLPDDVRRLAIAGDELFLLRGNGDLQRATRNQPSFTTVATGVVDVFSDKQSVYVLGTSGPKKQEGVARLDLGGTIWRHVLDVAAVGSLAWAADGAALVVQDGVATLHDAHRNREVGKVTNVFAHDGGAIALMAPTDETSWGTRIARIKLETRGRASFETERVDAALVALAQTPSVLYGLEANGRLVRIPGKGAAPRPLRVPYDLGGPGDADERVHAIFAVRGGLALATETQVIFHKAGAAPKTVPLAAEARVIVDPRTGVVHAVDGRSLWRWDDQWVRERGRP